MSFQDAPEEVLIEIFSYLTPKNVKVTALVCKRWNEVIGGSSVLMEKNFQLNLCESEGLIKRAKLRNFRHVRINRLSEAVLNILHLTSNLKSISISCCKLDPSLLVSTLKNFRQLEVFYAKAVDLLQEPTVTERVKLDKLKTLKIIYCDVSLVSIFNVTSLDSFEVSSLLKTECEKIIELLHAQRRLKKFHIGGMICENFFQTLEITKFSFRLEYLKIDKTSMGTKNDIELNFLKIHSDSLRKIILQYPINQVVQKFTMQHLVNLTHIQLPVAQINDQTLHELTPNRKIKSLTFFGMLQSFDKAKRLLLLFPSIEVFNMSQVPVPTWFMEFISFVADNNKNLKSLSLPYLPYHELHSQPFFPKLCEFSVTKIFHEALLDEFYMNHSWNLEKICIEHVEDDKFVKSLTIDKIMRCRNLKSVIIGCESPLVVRMFNNKVLRASPWTLETRIKNRLDFDHVSLKFHFPDDKAVWENNCRVSSDELVREFSTITNYGSNVFANMYK